MPVLPKLAYPRDDQHVLGSFDEFLQEMWVLDSNYRNNDDDDD